MLKGPGIYCWSATPMNTGAQKADFSQQGDPWEKETESSPKLQITKWFDFFFFPSVELPAEGCSTRWEGVDTLFAVLAKQSYSFRHYRHSGAQPNSFRGRNCGGQARAAVPAPPEAVQIALHSHILLQEQPLTLPRLEIFWYQLQQLSGMMFQCHTWFKENFQPYFST